VQAHLAATGVSVDFVQLMGGDLAWEAVAEVSVHTRPAGCLSGVVSSAKFEADPLTNQVTSRTHVRDFEILCTTKKTLPFKPIKGVKGFNGRFEQGHLKSREIQSESFWDTRVV
jgi:hypothetical protein